MAESAVAVRRRRAAARPSLAVKVFRCSCGFTSDKQQTFYSHVTRFANATHVRIFDTEAETAECKDKVKVRNSLAARTKSKELSVSELTRAFEGALVQPGVTRVQALAQVRCFGERGPIEGSMRFGRSATDPLLLPPSKWRTSAPMSIAGLWNTCAESRTVRTVLSAGTVRSPGTTSQLPRKSLVSAKTLAKKPSRASAVAKSKVMPQASSGSRSSGSKNAVGSLAMSPTSSKTRSPAGQKTAMPPTLFEEGVDVECSLARTPTAAVGSETSGGLKMSPVTSSPELTSHRPPLRVTKLRRSRGFRAHPGSCQLTVKRPPLKPINGEARARSSSGSPIRTLKSTPRNQDHEALEVPQRRLSKGLVLNPGSQNRPPTVEVVSGLAKSRRFSMTKVEGRQKFHPVAKSDPNETDADGCFSCDDLDGAELRGRSWRSQKWCVASDPFHVNTSELCESHLIEVPEAACDVRATDSIGDLFNRFVVAGSVGTTFEIFKELLSRCTPGREMPYKRLARLEGLPWRARSVWNLLDARARRAEYETKPLTACRAVVVGAGPCGLRAALELALLHSNVTVVEKRSGTEAFGRINRVHIWEWCKQDLLAWGAKVFDPPGGTFGGDNDFCHIGIAELQLLLLKSALLLGVRFRFGWEGKGLEDKVFVSKSGARIPCDALLIAAGANSPLTRQLGLKSVALELRGKGSAIGVVANFVNGRDAEQMALRQFSWARQFNQPLFVKLRESTGADLENIVYYKGPSHHYVVLTPRKRSLVEAGVLRDGDLTHRLLHQSNVDVDALTSMVKRIASFFELPTELAQVQGVMIFDFSGVRRLENPAVDAGGVFACAVGDALLEPFWPEGLGIIRGFMSALDAASAVVAAQSDRSGAVAQATETYNVLKSVGAQSASQCLQKDMRRYNLAPSSRYILARRAVCSTPAMGGG
mmetsp:Transcript_8931/g.24892  ORF Transcript_8931/g.24892 Transcript_8931/m.24892 type:complete len:930 (-) Transcript_8931:228-3017(-)